MEIDDISQHQAILSSKGGTVIKIHFFVKSGHAKVDTTFPAKWLACHNHRRRLLMITSTNTNTKYGF